MEKDRRSELRSRVGSLVSAVTNEIRSGQCFRATLAVDGDEPFQPVALGDGHGDEAATVGVAPDARNRFTKGLSDIDSLSKGEMQLCLGHILKCRRPRGRC